MFAHCQKEGNVHSAPSNDLEGGRKICANKSTTNCHLLENQQNGCLRSLSANTTVFFTNCENQQFGCSMSGDFWPNGFLAIGESGVRRAKPNSFIIVEALELPQQAWPGQGHSEKIPLRWRSLWTTQPQSCRGKPETQSCQENE